MISFEMIEAIYVKSNKTVKILKKSFYDHLILLKLLRFEDNSETMHLLLAYTSSRAKTGMSVEGKKMKLSIEVSKKYHDPNAHT